MRTLKSLFTVLLHPFKNFFNVFNKNIVKENRDLHFTISFLIVTAFLYSGKVIEELQINQLPPGFIILLGWAIAYALNFGREVYYARKENKFDFLDIYAGCYGGLVASIIYVICS